MERERGETLATVLARNAEVRAGEPWLVTEEETVTWAQALERARRTAGALALEPGLRFNVHLTNAAVFYDAWFAAAVSGAVMVPTNPLLKADELAYALDHAGCRLSVTQPDLRDTVEAAGADDVFLAGDLRGEPADVRAPAPRDTLGVLYTSGTTSRPKGVIVSHAAYLHAGEVVAGHVRLRPEDRNLVNLPLFHGNAQYYSSMSAFVTGASVALTAGFSASRWSAQATALGATVASLFAAPIRMILAAPEADADREHDLRLALFAQNVTPEEVERFERRFGVPLAQLYGMTETVFPPTMNPVFGERRNQTIGRPVSAARVRVVDGELEIAGEPGVTVMSGYLDDDAATAEVLGDDGWLRTGDSVREEDGYLVFVDRRKDLIKRAGENVSTVEVEGTLNRHERVRDAAVVGEADAMYDEVVVAYVVADGDVGADELIAWCDERLARFKVPARIEFVEGLPRTPVGKIQKHLINQEARDGVQAGSR